MAASQGEKEHQTFRLCEDSRLDGTFKAVICDSRPLGLGESTIIVCHGGKKCAVSIDGVEQASESQILIDGQLKTYLAGSTSSANATFTPHKLKPARSAELHVAARAAGQVDQEEWIRKRLSGKPLSEGLELKLYRLLAGDAHEIPVRVARTNPSPFAELVSTTQITFKPLTKDQESVIGVRWRDIGGLDKPVMSVRELVEFPMGYPELVTEIGIESPRGILLHGPPGTGKTLIARALANELDAHYYFIQGPEILSAYHGQSAKNLASIFERAEQEAADGRLAIILIDEIDSIAPKRDTGHGEAESQLVAMLLTLMEGLKTKKGLVVIGTTNRLNSIDPALRRPGRFEHEIYCGIPDTPGRDAILRIHSRNMPLVHDVDLRNWAAKTHGFTGADLAMLCREAGRNTFRRLLAALTGGEMNRIDFEPPPVTPEMLSGGAVRVTTEDFEIAASRVSPSGMREVLVQIPKDVTWDSIGGLKEVIRIIEENITKPLRHADVFRQMGIRPARGLLLYGPPGTGKTLLAKAVANECEANFISIKGPELRSKWFGESEDKVRFVFDTARKHVPCIIFFDEVDSLMPGRGKASDSGATDSIVNQFLAEMDGMQSAEGVFVIGATNRPELIDEALLRPGRFDYCVQVPLPDAAARREIFSIHLRKDVLAGDVGVDALVEKTDGLSGAQVAEICRLGGLIALREVNFERVNEIHQEHLLVALKEIEENRGSDGSTRFD